MITVAGCLLRLLTVLTTPYDVNAYDALEHRRYIEYVAEHYTIPQGSGGWEYHQSPLYYFVAGTGWGIAKAYGLSEQARIAMLQGFSLLLSIATFLLAVRLTQLLFRKKKERVALHACTALLAVLPAFVFFSHRLSNDIPFTTLSFLFLLQLTQWWQSQTQTRWLWLWVIVGIATLVRVTALSYIPILLLCLLAARLPRRYTWTMALQGIGIVLLLTGWLFVWRAMEPSSVRLLTFGNAFMNGALGLKTEWQSFLVFRPSAFLLFPFNHPFSDIAGRQYFWQFFFRSVFFGEFRFFALWQISTFILILGSLLLPCMLFGLIESIRQSARFFPIIATFFVLLAVLLLYRFLFPFSSNQDIRLMPLLFFPISCFLALGLQHTPDLLRPTVRLCFVLLCVLCVVFLVLPLL